MDIHSCGAAIPNSPLRLAIHVPLSPRAARAGLDRLEVSLVNAGARGVNAPFSPHPPPEQYELPLRAVYRDSSEALLWILAATAEDSQHIVEAIRLQAEGKSHSFFIGVRDGAPAFGANDLLAIRIGAELQLFASRLPAIPAQGELATEIARALRRQVEARATEAAEFLFVRLSASIREEQSVHADSALARALTFLQSAQVQENAPRLVSQMAQDILGALPSVASLALDGLMRRLKAYALFSLGRTLTHRRRELVASAFALFDDAARSFDLAGLAGQARACRRSARTLEQLVLYGESPEPVLPGFEPDDLDLERMHIKRPNFRAFRALAVPLSIRLPLDLGPVGAGTAGALHPIGAIALPTDPLVQALNEVQSVNLVPRLSITETSGAPLDKCVRISIEREHFSLLGIEDSLAVAGEHDFGVLVTGQEWECSPQRATARLGCPVEFKARALSRRAMPLSVLISSGADLGTFKVSAVTR